MKNGLHALKVAVVVGAITGLAACSSDQDTPAETLQAAYEHIANSEFSDLCDLVEPRVVDALARLAGSCQSGLARDFTVERRAALRDAEVHSDLITVHGDVATISPAAVTVGGQPVAQRGFKTLVRQDGKWWLAP